MTEQIKPELVERMVDLTRRMADSKMLFDSGWAVDARAIVAELPALVDPDLLLAREVAADAPQISQTRAAYIRQVECDAGEDVQLALAAIKRVRAGA